MEFHTPWKRTFLPWSLCKANECSADTLRADQKSRTTCSYPSEVTVHFQWKDISCVADLKYGRLKPRDSWKGVRHPCAYELEIEIPLWVSSMDLRTLPLCPGLPTWVLAMLIVGYCRTSIPGELPSYSTYQMHLSSMLTVKSNSHHCQDKAGVQNICFLLGVLTSGQFGILEYNGN